VDIAFKCDRCGQQLVVDEAGAGITVDCPGCGKPVYVPTTASQGAPVRVEVKSSSSAAPVPASKGSPASSSSGERRAVWSPPPLVAKYTVLRTIAGFYQGLAVVIAIIALLLAGFVILNGASVAGSYTFPVAVSIIVIGAISFVSFLAGAEGIRVFIDIEENTRATRQMMELKTVSTQAVASPPTNERASVAGTTSQPPKSSSQVRFGGTTSR